MQIIVISWDSPIAYDVTKDYVSPMANVQQRELFRPR